MCSTLKSNWKSLSKMESPAAKVLVISLCSNILSSPNEIKLRNQGIISSFFFSKEKKVLANPVPYLLKTKYYTAAIEFHFFNADELDAILSDEQVHFEAIVVIHDAENEKFTQSKTDTLASIPNLTEITCLCMAFNTSVNPSIENKMKQWCEENSFEYIENMGVIDGDNVTNTNNINKPNSFSEKQGKDRFIEALECTMWSSMNHLSKASMQSTCATHTLHTDDTSKQDSISYDSSEENDKQDFTDLFLGQKRSKARQAVGEENATPAVTSCEDVESAESFEKLLSGVHEIRQNSNNLTDEQRRKQAAEMAMKLWKFLGDSDDDDENIDVNFDGISLSKNT